MHGRLMSFRRILVTGGAGFIGSHLVRHLLRSHPGAELVNLDLLTYAGRPENLADVADDPRYRLVQGDIADREAVERAAEGCDAIVNVAAETHVDRSIFGGDEFIRTNVIGTKRLLDWAREHPGTRFVQVSTDEVYGDVEAPHRSREGDPLAGSSPYAASKAAGDLLVLAYARTYGVPASITRGSNTYGPYQFPEKLIPLFVTNAFDGRPLPVYGDGLQVREMLYVEDHCAAIDLVLQRGGPGEVYNVGAEHEVANIETTRRILALTGRDESLLTYVADRPGHDRRYALDCSKLRGLGWQRTVSFDEGLARTVTWFRENRAWWEPIKSGDAYASYAQRNYANR
jgi:dTDP-glucose 4,6-dehydratase